MALESPDAVVVGSGPNGLAAAITIARAGRSVVVYEAASTVGGGARSAELTLPGFTHDICSAVHPAAAASPFFKHLPLHEHGLQLVQPQAPLGHPMEGRPAVFLQRSVDETARSLGPDRDSYAGLMAPMVAASDHIVSQFLGPLRWPSHLLHSARFALRAVRGAHGLADSFEGAGARALIGGLAGHSILPFHKSPSAGIALMLGILGHSVGWPIVRGGSQKLADALASYLASLGGEVATGRRIDSLDQLPAAQAILFDTAPRHLGKIAGKALPGQYVRALKAYRHGPGVFKLDWALDGPIPWTDLQCAETATLHLGGTYEEMAEAESQVWQGRHPQRPLVLLCQPSLFDIERAPPGKHTAWAYCHVPNGSPVDMTAAIETQVERFAPGFRDLIVGRHAIGPKTLEAHNANCVGGDIAGGVTDLRQLLTRPAVRAVPYTTPNPRIYLCSSSSPPGPGVHGMCGYFAGRSALARAFR